MDCSLLQNFVLNSPEIGESQSKFRRPGRGSLLAKAGPKLNIPLYMVVVSVINAVHYNVVVLSKVWEG